MIEQRTSIVLSREELLEVFCSRLRTQLRLSHFRLKKRKCELIEVSSPSGNVWILCYLDMTTWSYGGLDGVYCADYALIGIEFKTVMSHLTHVLSVLKRENK
jgi:hypothetical protein